MRSSRNARRLAAIILPVPMAVFATSIDPPSFAQQRRSPCDADRSVAVEFARDWTMPRPACRLQQPDRDCAEAARAGMPPLLQACARPGTGTDERVARDGTDALTVRMDGRASGRTRK